MTGPPAVPHDIAKAAACASPNFTSSHLRPGMLNEPSTPSAAPMRATGVKRVWGFNPVACTVSPGWA
jgi:hypothetical protein